MPLVGLNATNVPGLYLENSRISHLCPGKAAPTLAYESLTQSPVKLSLGLLKIVNREAKAIYILLSAWSFQELTFCSSPLPAPLVFLQPSVS